MAIADWTLTPSAQIPFEWSTAGNPGGCAHWFGTYSGSALATSSIARNITIPVGYTKIQLQFDMYHTITTGGAYLFISDIGTMFSDGGWSPTVSSEWQTSPVIDVTPYMPVGDRTFKLSILANNVNIVNNFTVDNIKLIGVI